MSKQSKYILIAVSAFFLVLIGFIVYRMFFEFNRQKMSGYINDEAKKYGDNSPVAFSIISDGVKHLLSSYYLTSQVHRDAKASGTEKEKVLVHAAIMQAKTHGHLQ